jgi:hypothetical protein
VNLEALPDELNLDTSVRLSAQFGRFGRCDFGVYTRNRQSGVRGSFG